MPRHPGFWRSAKRVVIRQGLGRQNLKLIFIELVREILDEARDTVVELDT